MQHRDAIAEREGFKDRFAHALTRAGIDKDNITQVAEAFNHIDQSLQVTSFAVRKWLFGKAIPRQEKLRLIAERLGVTAAWLRFGEGDISTSVRSQKVSMLAANLEVLSEMDLVVVEKLVRDLSNKVESQ